MEVGFEDVVVGERQVGSELNVERSSTTFRHFCRPLSIIRIYSITGNLIRIRIQSQVNNIGTMFYTWKCNWSR